MDYCKVKACLLTLHPDAGGGGGLAVVIHRLACVDSDIRGPHTANFQLNKAKVEGGLDSGTLKKYNERTQLIHR